MKKQEKLILYLNQCMEDQKKEFRFKGIEDDDFFLFNGVIPGCGLGYETIFCKKFGFIERLCKNEKINYMKCKYGFQIYKKGEQIFLNNADEIILELSIQQKPVKYLLSILK